MTRILAAFVYLSAMKPIKQITSYFSSQINQSWNESFSADIITTINKLSFDQRKELRSSLFNEAKIIQLKNADADALNWLQMCFDQIDKHTFRMNHVYFSPGYDIVDNLRDLINQSKKTVDLCVFSITDERLAKAIRHALNRKIQVRIITDDMKTNDRGSKIDWLDNIGIEVKTDHSRYHMHNKFGIIDGRIAFTGSFNWTITASKANQENILVTSNDQIVTEYHREFCRLWQEMHKY